MSYIYDFSQIIVVKLVSFRRSFEGVCPAPKPHPGHPTPLTIEAVWHIACNFPVFQLLQVDMDASRNNVTPTPPFLVRGVGWPGWRVGARHTPLDDLRNDASLIDITMIWLKSYIYIYDINICISV